MIKLVKGSETLDLSTIPNVGISWTRQMQGTANFANNYKKIPHNPIITYYGSDYGNMPIPVELVFNFMDLVKVESIRRQILEFCFDDRGQPEELKMYISYEKEPEPKYRKVRLSEHPNISYEVGFHKMSLQFVTNSRFLYGGIRTKSLQMDLSVGGSAVQLNPLGIQVRPTITITGTAEGLNLKSNGEVINVGNVTSGEPIVIDLWRYHSKEGSANKFIRIPMNFSIGNDGVVVAGSSGTITIKFDWQDIYL